MTKVIIAGAAGRMGRRIGYMVNEHPDLQIAAGFERPDSPDLGKDVGELGGYGPAGIKVADSLEAVIEHGDVIIDFTFHDCRNCPSLPKNFPVSRPRIWLLGLTCSLNWQPRWQLSWEMTMTWK